MPKFQFNKLVRDKFPDIYAKLGQVIVSEKLTGVAYRGALRDKIIEEANELPVGDGVDPETLAEEIADIQQIIDDLCIACNITPAEVATRQAEKAARKGGFSTGLFVQTIALQDDDKDWINYYRAEPEKYPELPEQ